MKLSGFTWFDEKSRNDFYHTMRTLVTPGSFPQIFSFAAANTQME